MDIIDLMPKDSDSSKDYSLSENQKIAFKFIQDAVFTVEKAYLSINSESARNKIKAFMCDKSLLEAELAIEKQYQSALAGDAQALKNVQSGMQYWQKLVMLQINQNLEASPRLANDAEILI